MATAPMPQPAFDTVVMKFGGSSVADAEKVRAVAQRLVAAKKRGLRVVGTVSAMGKTTDTLLALAHEVSPDPDPRELDMLLSTGERAAMSLLSIAIQARGFEAISFTGSQSGILTNDRHFDARVDLGYLYPVFIYFVVAGTTSAVNLTDGLDGLAAGCAAIVLLAYIAITFTSGQTDLALIAACLVGACVGFLWFNSFPASIFMGDTGSLGLGGAIAAMAVMTKTEVLLIILGGIFVIEALSVLLQVFSFQVFRKRIFLMAPIHHHFELQAWSETKIILRFWIVAAVCSAIGFTLYQQSLT